MRISKAPEERKQEILTTAIRLFCEKGFEKTSISDITKEIDVAQGLCYHYFPSKEILFNAAIDEYADSIISSISKKYIMKETSLKSIINELYNDNRVNNIKEVEKSLYYEAFHKSENRMFRERLSIQLCEKLVIKVKGLLASAQNKGEININDFDTFANFCVYGQLGILNNSSFTREEKNKKIKDFLFDILKL